MIGALRIVGWLVPLSLVQGAIVAAAVWAVLRALPLDRARLRHGVAVGGLATVAAGFLVTAGILGIDWGAHVACWTSRAHAVSAGCRAHGVPAPEGAEPEAKASAVLGWKAWVRVPSVSGERTAALSWTRLAAVAGLAWLLALGLLGLRERRIRRAVRDLRADAAPVDDPRLLAALERLRDAVGVREAVEIRESRRVSTPCVTGSGPATILLPAGLRSALDPAELRGVLAHELAHVRRGDVRTLAIQRVLLVAFFFNPFAAWLGRRAREEREVACDRVAAGTEPVSRADYARTLLLLEGFRAAPLGLATAPALLGEGELAARVERLLDRSRPGRSARRYAIAALAAVLLGTALAQATLAGAALGSWAVMAADRTYDHRTPDPNP